MFQIYILRFIEPSFNYVKCSRIINYLVVTAKRNSVLKFFLEVTLIRFNLIYEEYINNNLQHYVPC